MIELGVWQVELPGESYEWRPDDMLLSEILTVEHESGRSFTEWTKGIDARDPVSCQVLIWWLRRKEGKHEERTQVDFPLRRLEVRSVEGEAEAANTPPSEPTPSSDSTSTDTAPATSTP